MTNNDIKIVSLMALELKNTFDKQFNNYKENVGKYKEFVGPDGPPKIKQNLENTVDEFFGKINNRLEFLESTVIKSINEKTEVADMEKSVQNFVNQINLWSISHEKSSKIFE